LLAYFVYRIREKTESIRSKNAFPKKKKLSLVSTFFALDRERAEKAKTENEEEKK